MAELTKKQQAERKTTAAEWKQFRADNLFTQLQLAAVLGMSKRQVQNIEWGNSKPSYSTASKFRILKAKHDNGLKGA